MNYKKTLLTTSILTILFGVTQANDYISIISQEKNVYDIIENSLPIATEWVDVGAEFSCVKEFNTYDYPLGQSFTQNENCLQKQERTITTTEVFNGTPRTTVKNDYQNIPVVISYLETGQENFNTGNQRTEYTTWLDSGNHYACTTFVPLLSNINLGESFTQNRDCSQNQERTETVYDIWADGSEILNNSSIETQILTETESQNAIGTKNFNTGSQRIEYTNWLNSGVHYSCDSFSPLSTTIRLGEPLSQNRNCSQDQNRTKITHDIWADSSETVNNTLIETQTLIENETQNTTGTGLATSCKNILDSGWNKGSGVYELNLQSGNVNVTCDMGRNGGGWMLVERYEWDVNSNNTPQGLVKTVARTISTYPILLDGWYIPDILIANDNNLQWTEITSQPIIPWTQTMIEFEGIGHRSLDDFNNVHNNGILDRHTINGQYTDGFSFTSGEHGSRKHLYTVSVGYAPVDDEGRLSTTLSWLGNNYDFKDMSDSYSLDYPSTAFYSRGYGDEILSPIMTESSDKISLRLMADQAYVDETIGIRKYILWVK